MIELKQFKVIALVIFLATSTSCVPRANNNEVVNTTASVIESQSATPQSPMVTKIPTLHTSTFTPNPIPSQQKTSTPTMTATSEMQDWCALRPRMGISQMFIGFDAGWDGDNEIYTVRGDGSDLKQLTKNEANDFNPLWSPDGKRIAFMRTIEADGDKYFPLFVMNNDGLNETQLTPSSFSVMPGFAWSPDAQRIAFEGRRHDGSVGIYVINADGSSLTILFEDYSYIDMGSPTWAPDGKTIAFQATDDPAFTFWRLYTVKSDGSDLKRIEAKGLADKLPQWHPKEDRILFISQSEMKSVPFQLFTINPDGSDRKQLTESETDNWNALWSPNGQMIAYVATTERYGPQPKEGLHVLNADGTNDITIFEIDQYIGVLKWAPNDLHIAFISTESGSPDLYTIDICNGTVNRVVKNVNIEHEIDWMP